MASDKYLTSIPFLFLRKYASLDNKNRPEDSSPERFFFAKKYITYLSLPLILERVVRREAGFTSRIWAIVSSS